MPERRKLNLKARADRQAQTRQRIIEAAVTLHTTVGPAHTTISAIAEGAGVQRQTVYTHFPDERSLFSACAAHVRATYPPPDAAAWRAIADPVTRLRTALDELYSYFRRTTGAWSAILRDAEVNPLVREMAATRRLGYLDEARDALVAGWKLSVARRRQVAAAAGLAVDYRTWETLTARQGLDDLQAAHLMANAVIELAETNRGDETKAARRLNARVKSERPAR